MLQDVVQHPVQRSQTCLIGADADFSQEQMISGCLRPLRDCGHALYANSWRDDARMRTATVEVEVLVDLEREIVERDLERRSR